MRRWLVRLSILLMLGTAAVWARSYREVHTLYFGRAASGTWQVGCDRGRLFWLWCTAWREMKDRPPAFQVVAYQARTWARYQAILRQNSTGQWRFLGFGHDQGTIDYMPAVDPDEPPPSYGYSTPPGPPYRQGQVPAWPLVLPGVVAVALGAKRRWSLRRWRKAGRCQGCGYDLRASTDRCPECGRPIVQADRSRSGQVGWRRGIVWCLAVAAAGVFVAAPLTYARQATRLARRWESRDTGPRPTHFFLRWERTPGGHLVVSEFTATDERGRRHDVLPKVRRRELYADGDFTYGSDRHTPTRFWFDGDVLVRDSVTPPFFIDADRDVPGRLLPAPPPSPTASTQPLTPR